MIGVHDSLVKGRMDRWMDELASSWCAFFQAWSTVNDEGFPTLKPLAMLACMLACSVTLARIGWDVGMLIRWIDETKLGDWSRSFFQGCTRILGKKERKAGLNGQNYAWGVGSTNEGWTNHEAIASNSLMVGRQFGNGKILIDIEKLTPLHWAKKINCLDNGDEIKSQLGRQTHLLKKLD